MKRVLDAMVAISSDLDLPTVLHRIVEAACELAQAQYGALGVIGTSDTQDLFLTEFITEGAGPEMIKAIGHYPRGHGILGLLIKEPKPIRLQDLTAHAESHGFPEGHPHMHSFLGVPVRIRDEVFGNLYLTEKKGGGDFTAEDEELVVALAAGAGVAIQNARLQERLKDLAVLEDRERIARDLHDTVIQRLFATGLSLQGLARVSGDIKFSDRIQHAVDELDDTIREIRSMIFSLQARDSDHSFRISVLAQVVEATETLGFEPRVHFQGPVNSVIDAETGSELLTVLREMLSNVAKHAAATEVDVSVIAGSQIELIVRDNGKGPGELRPGGNGLANLKARSEALGGNFELAPGKSGGSEARWSIPRKAS